jgi:integrase/recombinase XerD
VARAVCDEAEEYLTWLAVEQGRSRNTLLAYRRDLSSYEGYLAERGLEPAAASEADVEAYLAARLAEGISPASVSRALACIRGMHRFLVEEGMAAGDPTADVSSPRVPYRLPKALNEAEVLALLATAKGATPIERRDLAILELLYGTGIRVSELTGLSLTDLRPGSGLLRVTGKGSRERLVPLVGAAAEALGRWLGPGGRPELVPRRWARRQDSEAVFLNARGGRIGRQGVWLVISRHAEAAGLERKVHPHVLRHSCATHMLEHGADIRVVQELLGHVSIATTQVYTLVSPEHLRKAYEAAHPRAGRARAL